MNKSSKISCFLIDIMSRYLGVRAPSSGVGSGNCLTFTWAWKKKKTTQNTPQSFHINDGSCRSCSSGWEIGNLQHVLHALNCEEHPTTGIPAPCSEAIITESCHVFSGTFVKRGSLILNRIKWGFLPVISAKAEFLAACVSDGTTKPCFISSLCKKYLQEYPENRLTFTTRQADQDGVFASLSNRMSIPDSVL